jgi:hypothetical protein
MEIIPLEIIGEASNLFNELRAISPLFEGVFQFISNWWWFPLPFILWPIFVKYYLKWRQHLWDLNERPESISLEIRPPSDIKKPIRAMEAVLHGFWQIYGPPNWYQKWMEGEQDLSFSMEIAGIDGVPHFLVRVPKPFRDLFESHIYSQYAEAEIREVEDYTKKVPSNIPNERWDFMGCGYQMVPNHFYPITTYKEFETEMEDDEEKVDPIASLMESIATLKEGEQIWIQIKAKPVASDNDGGFIEKAEAERDKLLNRVVEEKNPEPRSILEMLLEFMTEFKISDRASEEEKEEQRFAPEMMLSQGERRKVDGLERKISKKYFKCHIMHIYLGRKDVIDKAKFKMPMSYFNNFSNNNGGSIVPKGAFITKQEQNWYNWFLFPDRRKYLIKRKFIRNYIRRTPLYYPNVNPSGQFILNTEELATLFHFPSKIAAPPSILERVESKKAEAPWGLPTE